jgi:hypothetical protein
MTHLVSIERAYLFYTKRNVFVPGREKKKTSPGGKSRQQSATPSLRCNIATATNRFFFQMGKHGGGGGGFVFVVVKTKESFFFHWKIFNLKKPTQTVHQEGGKQVKK